MQLSQLVANLDGLYVNTKKQNLPELGQDYIITNHNRRRALLIPFHSRPNLNYLVLEEALKLELV